MPGRPLYKLPRLDRGSLRGHAVDAVIVYFGGLTVLSGILTQWVAYHYGFHPDLGLPLVGGVDEPFRSMLLPGGLVLGALAVFCLAVRRLRAASLIFVTVSYALVGLGTGPLYHPAALYAWTARFWFAPGHRNLLEVPLLTVLTVAALGMVGIVLFLNAKARSFHERADIHGSARLANHDEVEAAGLLDAKGGILLGIWHDDRRTRYLRHDGPEHALVFAPTRSGKGVGLVLPNLLTWPHSVLVHDIKGENWALSSGWRSRELGSLCLRFDPTDTTGTAAHYNPLNEVRLGPNEVRDAQTVADILVDPNGDRLRDHWDRTAHALLTAVILHVLYAEEDKSLRGCLHFLAHPTRRVEQALQAMMKVEHVGKDHSGWIDSATGETTRVHPEVSSAARAVLDKAENERSGLISTALTFLDLYRDPVLAANTSDSTFRLDDLMHSARPISLYLTVPSSDLSRTRPLVRMILNQACRRLTERLEFRDGAPVQHYRYPLLMMLDEFPALGRLDFFTESLAFLAGYGIRCFLISQDLAQLHGLYGTNESITGNCHIRIAFAPNKPRTAELLSRMTGVMTVHEERRSYRGGHCDPLLDRQQVSPAHSRRLLFTADELMRLPADDLLLFVGGHRPIRATKIKYFADRELAWRASIAPPLRGFSLPS